MSSTSTSPPAGGSILGNRVVRTEDPGLLTGSRRYLADRHAHWAALRRRPSALVRLTPAVSVRATGGLGYKAPTVFLEPSETREEEGS